MYVCECRYPQRPERGKGTRFSGGRSCRTLSGTWVLGTDLGFPERVASALTTELSPVLTAGDLQWRLGAEGFDPLCKSDSC